MNRKKILIVEDDADTQTLLKKRLEKYGFECFSAYTVESALKSLKTILPDLVLLDLGFSSASGTAFLQVAKEWLPRDCEPPPIIVLSGHKEEEIVELALDYGAKGFLAKPVDPNSLLTMVNHYIR